MLPGLCDGLTASNVDFVSSCSTLGNVKPDVDVKVLGGIRTAGYYPNLSYTESTLSIIQKRSATGLSPSRLSVPLSCCIKRMLKAPNA